MYTNRRTKDSYICKPCVPDVPVVDESETKDIGSSSPTCSTCHTTRHSLNLSPVDKVFGLCDSPKCQLDPMVSAADEGNTEPGVRNKGNSSNHFTIRTTCDGKLLRTLLDTGATANFMSEAYINATPDLNPHISAIKPMSVRLGNNSVQIVRKQINVETWIGNKPFRISYLVMPLPAGIDSILGMGFFNEFKVWLNPSTKQIIVPDRTTHKFITLAYCVKHDEDDTHLIRQAHLTDGATQSHMRRPDKVDPSSHDKRNATPHGLAWISEDKMSEAYNVSDKQMKYLLHLMENNKLNHDTLDKFISSGYTKLHGVDVTEAGPRDSSGVEYTARYGGQATVHTLLSLESQKHVHDNAEAAFLVEPKTPEPQSRPLYQNPEHSLHMAIGKSNTDPPSTATTSGTEGQLDTASLPTPIQYPEGFSPSLIDATEPEFRDWTQKLMQQKIKKFSCMEALKRHIPLPGDPLLDIRIKHGHDPGELKNRFIKTPVHMQAHLKEFLETMMAAGLIRPSRAPFSAPVLVIPKPRNADGSSRGFRLVTDYRALNKIVEPIQHHIPDVHAMYEKLRNATYITTLDLKNGYWNAGLTEESKPLTSFSTEFGQYEYNVVPQGLVCSAAHFQKWVETKLRRHGILFEHVTINPNLSTGLDSSRLFDENGRYIGTTPIGIAKMQGESGFCAVYIDDLIVFSDTAESHKRHLLQVMQVCSDEGLYLNMPKSHVFTKYTRYLGAVCGNGQLFMDPSKVEAILAMPNPSASQTAVREFLGATSFYRRWIDSYARTVEPLQGLLKDEAKGRTQELWDKNKDKYESVIKTLKHALCSYPVLRQPDYDRPMVLYTDASDYAIGAALCQEFEGKLCAIHFASRSLIKAERNYSVQEKEALAIVFGVKKFRKSILGSRFKIRCLTDHKSLECLTNANELAGRMARWAMIMSEYNYSVEYIKGATNTAADALSRLIAMPDEAWRPLTLTEDRDDDHPFLLLWPDVHLLCIASQYDPARATTYDIETCMTTDEALKAIEREERLNSPLHDTIHHELILFSRTTVYTGDVKVLNIHADLYSQCPDFKLLYEYLTQTDTENSALGTLTELDKVPGTAVKRKKTSSDTSTSDRKRKLPQPDSGKNGRTDDTKKLLSKFDLSNFFIDPGNKLLYFLNRNGQEVLCVPDIHTEAGESLRYHIFMEMHDSPFYGHRGAVATYGSMRTRFYWPKMYENIQQYIQACPECQNNKIDRSKPKGRIQPLQNPAQPGQSLNMDFMTDLPRSYYRGAWYDTVWVLVDRCSHRVYGLMCRKNNTAEDLSDLFLHEYVLSTMNGLPLELIGDRDKIFTSHHFDHLSRRLGISLRLSSARSQQTNGKAERKIAALEEVLRNGVNYRQDNWTEVLQYALFALNQAPNPTLDNRSSLYYERGFNPITPIDTITSLPTQGMRDKCPKDVTKRLEYLENMRSIVQDKLNYALNSYEHYYNARRKDDTRITVGSLVRLNLDHIKLQIFRNRPTSKLNPLWYGPFKVIAQPSTVSFTLELPNDSNIHDTFHVSRLKLANDKSFSNLVRKQVHIPTNDEDDGDYEVERLLDHYWDHRTKSYYYLVKWRGYNEIFESRWEPRIHLEAGSAELLKDYDAKHGIEVSSQVPQVEKGEDSGTTKQTRKRQKR